jgi:hypothetical protein
MEFMEILALCLLLPWTQHIFFFFSGFDSVTADVLTPN